MVFSDPTKMCSTPQARVRSSGGAPTVRDVGHIDDLLHLLRGLPGHTHANNKVVGSIMPFSASNA